MNKGRLSFRQPPLLILFFQKSLTLLSRNLLRLHVGVDVLHVVKLLKTLHHLVDGCTLLSVDVLKVVRHVSKLTADVLEALVLKELLNLSVSLYVVAVDGDCAFFLVLIKLVLYVEVESSRISSSMSTPSFFLKVNTHLWSKR